MEESLGLGKKSSGPETDTETWSWFRLPIPKPGFGRTLTQNSILFFIIEKVYFSLCLHLVCVTTENTVVLSKGRLVSHFQWDMGFSQR